MQEQVCWNASIVRQHRQHKTGLVMPRAPSANLPHVTYTTTKVLSQGFHDIATHFNNAMLPRKWSCLALLVDNYTAAYTARVVATTREENKEDREPLPAKKRTRHVVS